MRESRRQRPGPGINPTERSLAEQLQINDREIQSRKELLDFTPKDEELLVELQPWIAENLEEIVDTFYERQLQSREIALVIGDAETLQRLRGSMRRYILELFEGLYDAEYVNKRLRIGKVHQRIGVSPKLYVSALTLLQTILMNNLFTVVEGDEDFDYPSIEQRRGALRKLMMFDMQMVFDTYISTLVAEVDTARLELEEYAEGLEETIAERTEQLRELSTRDALTGLHNQRGFYEHLRRELAVAERNSDPLALIYFDLNNFKKLNDTKGHREGDRVLALVGKALLSAVRTVDFGCRYGGDEFCIIMPRTGMDEAHEVYYRVIQEFDQGKTEGVTFSAGITQTGLGSYVHMDTLIKHADTRMYQAKALARKNPGHYTEPPHKNVTDPDTLDILPGLQSG